MICDACGKQRCFHRVSLKLGCSNYVKKTLTNADRIRAMSDEELADWLARTQIDNVTEACQIVGVEFPCGEGTLDKTQAEVLTWLKQPVDGE